MTKLLVLIVAILYVFKQIFSSAVDKQHFWRLSEFRFGNQDDCC